MIRFENISKTFTRGNDLIQALDGVSLEVPESQLGVIRGPSGSGKTTLINIGASLMEPSSGDVVVAGSRLSEMAASGKTVLRATRVAVVFQLFHLVPYLSAIENVLLPTLAAGDGTADQEDAAGRARELLEQVGIQHRSAHYPDEMSAGERQRCALARALFNRPKVILADEPTGNLDPASAARVLSVLDQCRRGGATILLVSHQPVEAIEPDLEFVLEGGRLAE